ncbi:hypothetical protein Aph01nite_48210 [Acrocarpospora phusangensis]|uniref:Uncharacterized protein n=1 Tax=Acrocarpospora phusangensis TaxID=1070424 RepID=A0A919QEL4_9ACTN|nr:hypothetical protein [Acrocarpospora phusangensis]GIH26511.1 hypothetical protein Aph01nite_48210 [Acrocarpospora phusangensis]
MRRNPFPGTGPDRPRPPAFPDHLVTTPPYPMPPVTAPTAAVPRQAPPIDPYADDPPEAVTGQRPVQGRHARPMPVGVQPWQGWLPSEEAGTVLPVGRPIPPPRPAPLSAPVADADIAYEMHLRLRTAAAGLQDRPGETLSPDMVAAVRELRQQTMQLMSALEAAIENQGGVLWPGPARRAQR